MDYIEPLTVSSSWIEFLLECAKFKSCDLRPKLHELGVSEQDLMDEAKRFPLELEQELFNTALQKTGDTYFGLHMGERVRPNFVGILGYASMSSESLRDAVDLLVKYEQYYTEVARCCLVVDDASESFYISWIPEREDLPHQRHRVESSFSSWVFFGRWITGTEQNPLKVEFTHEPPEDDTSEYERIFRCPVHFGQDRNAIHLRKELFDLPVLDANAEVNRVTMERIQALVSAYEARGDLLKEVKVTIRECLARGAATLEIVADELSIKPWTLRRKLRALDSDFTTLLDDVRKSMAVDLLQRSDCQISEIAGSLGYSEQSAFNRAFKRWFGCTPLEYRSQNS